MLNEIDNDSIVERVLREGALARIDMNELTHTTFQTRGGRMGSGMGLLLEGLWGYLSSARLRKYGIEMAWLADDEYNDFACVDLSGDWDPATKTGEHLRIEVKSMNTGTDEQKAHFDELHDVIGANDLLAVMSWSWAPTKDGNRVWPRVDEIFIDAARPIARFRDVLHEARGGTFVQEGHCPDECGPAFCSHVGEPLNAKGKRERRFGPEAARVSNKVSYAQNFGGMTRMTKARGRAKEVREEALRSSTIARNYVEFIERFERRVEEDPQGQVPLSTGADTRQRGA